MFVSNTTSSQFQNCDGKGEFLVGQAAILLDCLEVLAIMVDMDGVMNNIHTTSYFGL